jgi:transposase
LRFIGLDVHKDFCVVAISDGGKARQAGRVKTRRDELELFAQSLAPDDKVVLEATGNAFAIARVLEPHVGEVVIANPRRVRAISHAKVKNDQFDARTLAELLAGDLLHPVWIPDEQTRVLRRLAKRRLAIVVAMGRHKAHVFAALQRNLYVEPQGTDLFGKRGRAWMASLQLPGDERQTIAGDLRQFDFLASELKFVEREIAQIALAREDIKRLMTIPGVDMITAATMVAAIGDISRFPTSRHLVGYLGLDARVRQSGASAARTGRISKEGSAEARRVLVEAAWSAKRAPGPLRAFGQRVQARRGSQIATVAVARKIAVLCWQLLTRGEDYAHHRPTLHRRKLRKLELRAGSPSQQGKHNANPIWETRTQDERERDLVAQAEASYKRTVADWKASGPNGTGAAPGRALKAARQDQAPDPAL